MNKLSPSSQHLRVITPVMGSGLTPKTIFGTALVQWLRADMGVTVDGSNNVSAWADQSGNNNNAVQGVAGQRPSFVTTGGPNGGPHIYSDVVFAQPWLDMSANTGYSTTLAEGWTVVMIYTAATNPGVAGTWWSTTIAPADGSIIQWRRDSGNRASNVMTGVAAPNFLTVTTPDMVPVDTWIATVMTCDSGRTRTVTVYGDGTSGTVSNVKAANCNISLGTGRIFRDGVTYYQSMRIQELIAAKTSATTSQIGMLKTYIRSRGIVFS